MESKAQNNEVITIDLLEIAQQLWMEKVLILLSTIAGVCLAVIITVVALTPMYTSNTTLYIMANSSGTNTPNSADMQTATQLTTDYVQMVTKRPVMEEVIDDLGLKDETTSSLAGKIHVENPTNTRFLIISVTYNDPKKAQAIADSVRESVSKQIVKVMSADTVNTVEKANLPTSPSSPNTKRNVVIGGMLGFLLACAFFILKYILDDTIKTPTDVEKYLGLNTLAAIPETGEGTNTRGKKRKNRKK